MLNHMMMIRKEASYLDLDVTENVLISSRSMQGRKCRPEIIKEFSFGANIHRKKKKTKKKNMTNPRDFYYTMLNF